MSRTSALAFLIAFISLLAFGAIALIILRAPSTADELTLIAAVIAFLSPLITSLVALYRAETANGSVKQVVQAVQNHIDNAGPGV